MLIPIRRGTRPTSSLLFGQICDDGVRDIRNPRDWNNSEKRLLLYNFMSLVQRGVNLVSKSEAFTIYAWPRMDTRLLYAQTADFSETYILDFHSGHKRRAAYGFCDHFQTSEAFPKHDSSYACFTVSQISGFAK